MNQFPPPWFSKFLGSWAEIQGAPHRETASNCAPPCRGLFPTVGDMETSVRSLLTSCAFTPKPPHCSEMVRAEGFRRWLTQRDYILPQFQSSSRERIKEFLLRKRTTYNQQALTKCCIPTFHKRQTNWAQRDVIFLLVTVSCDTRIWWRTG